MGAFHSELTARTLLDERTRRARAIDATAWQRPAAPSRPPRARGLRLAFGMALIRLGTHVAGGHAVYRPIVGGLATKRT